MADVYRVLNIFMELVRNEKDIINIEYISNNVVNNDLYLYILNSLMSRIETNDINYIVYNDGTRDFRSEEEIFASRYTIEDGNFILSEIENDYEWDLIDNMLESKYKEID